MSVVQQVTFYLPLALPRSFPMHEQETSRSSESTQRSWSGWLFLGSYLATLIVLLISVLKLQGRLWWCECGELTLWVSQAMSAHTSQHLFDPYSFTHVAHGFIFCGLLFWWLPQLSLYWKFFWTLAIECAWEILENTEFVIQRYRDATAALGYEGDSIGNSLGDVLACGLGFWIALRLGWRKTTILLVIMESVLLMTIRDNLALNVVMLFFPMDWLKEWQAG